MSAPHRNKLSRVNSSERANTRTACLLIAHIRVRILSTSTALLLLSECTTVLPTKSIRDMPAVWSACLLCGLMLCGLVRWSYAVVFALLFQVSKLVSGCVVLEAVRVVHVIICKCVVQRGVAVVFLTRVICTYCDRLLLLRCCIDTTDFHFL